MLLRVHVHPRASRARVVREGDALEVWVTPPAADGAANRAVVAALAEWLHVPRGAVTIRSGARARVKLVEVEGVAELPPG